MASRSIDLISKKKIACEHTFFSNQQKTNLHVQHAFFFSNYQKKQICTCSTLFVFLYRCFAQLQRCFVGLKHQTSWLNIIFIEELSHVLTQYFVSSCSLLFFTATHFHLAGRQHFLLSHSRFEFSCFSSYKISLFCFQSLALALSLLST